MFIERPRSSEQHERASAHSPVGDQTAERSCFGCRLAETANLIDG